MSESGHLGGTPKRGLLSKIRIESGYCHDDLHYEIGIPLDAVLRHEADLNTATPAELEKYAKFFECKVEDLFE